MLQHFITSHGWISRFSLNYIILPVCSSHFVVDHIPRYVDKVNSCTSLSALGRPAANTIDFAVGRSSRRHHHLLWCVHLILGGCSGMRTIRMVASQSRSSFSPSFRAWLAIHVFSVSQRVSDHPPSRPSNYSCVRRHIHGNIVQGEIRIVRSRARPSCRQQNAAFVVGGWWKVEGLLLLSTAEDGRTDVEFRR